VSAVARIGVLLCVAHLGCDRVLGLEDIVPDGSPVKLLFDGIPPPVVVQRPFDIVMVHVLDIQGQPAHATGMEIKLTLGDNPSGAKLLGTVTATVTGDAAYFGLVFVDKPGNGYSLVASADGLMPATMDSIDVVPPPFTHVATGVDGGQIVGIAVSPAPSGGSATVFAAAAHGVYTSTNGGSTWEPPGIGGDVSEGFVVVDPQHPGVAYLASNRRQRYLLKKTEDGGATWRAVNGDDVRLNTEHTFSMAVDPKDPSTVYAVAYDYYTNVETGSSGLKLHRSTDGGATWSTTALPGSGGQLAIDPVTPSTLYYATSNDGVYKSTDAGASWTAAKTGLGSLYTRGLVATPNALFVDAGGTLYRSTDAAASWTALSITFPSALAYAPSMPRRMYLYHGAGVAVSNDAGASFGTAVRLPYSFAQLAVDAKNPDVVYAATYAGVYLSTDGGATWSLSSKGIDAPPIVSVALAPNMPGTLLASTSASVIRTTNSGASWTPVAQQAQARLAFDPTVATTAYLCSGSGFATSTNSGASFGASTDPGVSCQHLAFAGTTFFVAGSGFAAGGSGLRKSTNRGATWADTGIGDRSVNGVALGDGVGNVVLAHTQTGLYRSTNGGTSFMQVMSDPTFAILADPKAPSHVIASGSGSGNCELRLSTDGGATFGPSVSDVCVSMLGAAGSALYAAGFEPSSTDRLWTSTNGGTSWVPVVLTGGVPDDITITSVSASQDGKTVYLGTSAGLYKSAGP
jgi:hypothetical protein